MRPALHLLRGVLLAPFLLGLLGSCRDGKTNTGAAPISMSVVGANGCNGPNNSFSAPAQVFQDLAVVGAMSQLAASATEDKVYVSGADGSILELDFTTNALVPVVTTVLAAGVLDTFLAGLSVPLPPAVISGLALLTPTDLVVVEHTSNTLFLVSLDSPGLSILVGFPSQVPSLVDGVDDMVRFSFPPNVPLQVCPTGDGRIFVADAGNHVIRQLTVGARVEAITLAGTGVPSHSNGVLPGIGLDTPVGVAVGCGGDLLVTEVGPLGNRLRSIQLGTRSFFGGIQGLSMTVAGDGMPLTVQGVGEAASAAGPVSPVVTGAGEIYWVDSLTGILRRYDLVTGLVDCPFFADCAVASGMGGSFSGASNYSAVVTPSGVLYVLDGLQGAIFAVGT